MAKYDLPDTCGECACCKALEAHQKAMADREVRRALIAEVFADYDPDPDDSAGEDSQSPSRTAI